MDPDKNLIEILDLCESLSFDRYNRHAREELVEKLEQLTKWIKHDGFSPRVSHHIGQEGHHFTIG